MDGLPAKVMGCLPDLMLHKMNLKTTTYGPNAEKCFTKLTPVVQHKVSICLQLVESYLEDASKNPVDDLDE